MDTKKINQPSEYLNKTLKRFLIGNLIALAIEFGVLFGTYMVIQSQISGK